MIKYGIHLGKIDTDPRAALAEIRAAGFDAVLLHLGGKYPNAQLADDIAAAGLVIGALGGLIGTAFTRRGTA